MLSSSADVAKTNLFRLGLIINPWAGIGGSVALKGSDDMAQQALALGAVPMAQQRAKAALTELLPLKNQIRIYTFAADMGQEVAKALGFAVEVVGQAQSQPSTAMDTEQAAAILVEGGVDLLLFAGGDGTARNICTVIANHHSQSHTTVLGIPAGCKIHSGVYAITPAAAGKVVAQMVRGELVTVQDAQVMDIDEVAFRAGTVRAKRYGEMQIPSELRYVQSVKTAGKESEELVLDDLAAYVASQMEEGVRYVMGSGSTVAAVMSELGLPNTLLGVDVVENGEVIASDVTAAQLLSLIQGHPCKLIITLIGGQGHIFGRGNQQLSPDVIRVIGRDNIMLIATKTKLQQLQGRPLISDSGDAQLDQQLQGMLKVLCGYNDYVMYRLGIEGVKMQQPDDFIQAISSYFDQSVASATDDELFAAGYLRGHVDLGIGRLQVAELPFASTDIIGQVDESLAAAILAGELSEADEQLVRHIWQQVQALAA